MSMANIGSTQLLTPTPGSSVTIGAIDTTVRTILASWTAGEAETLNVSGTPVDGQRLTLVITNDGVLGRILTLGTGLLGLGIITGVTSKKSTVSFIALSGTFIETSRSVGL
jgi:hypothetical protein